VEVDFTISGGPSIFFDSVVLLPSAEGCGILVAEAAAVNWVRDAFGHLKVIGHNADAVPLLEAASVETDAGVIEVAEKRSLGQYIKTARGGRRWEREPTLRSIG
jgi:catalase